MLAQGITGMRLVGADDRGSRRRRTIPPRQPLARPDMASCDVPLVAASGHSTRGGRASAHPPYALPTEKARYRVSGSIWTILLVCWPSVHMLERTSGFELFCTSIWRVLMDVGRRYELHSPVSTLSRCTRSVLMSAPQAYLPSSN